VKLKISDSLSLPLDFVTSTQVILAQKGKGKTHTAIVEAEELLEAEQHVVIIDPTDAWWGLRSSKDGKHDGYSIAVFGGDHGDVALEPGGGKLLAEAIVAERFSAVISTENLTKGQELSFVADFMETLYRLNRQALHLFIDEADIFAPQKPFGGEARTCGAADDIVRRGRKKGIGCTLITQRSSVLNKNVLSQADMLVALGCSHPRDIDAIAEWVKRHADPKLANEMMESLPSLPRGEAWVWNPAGDIFKRVTIRERRTFDSGRTPRPGEAKHVAKKLAKVDIERLGAAIASQVERQKENDPRALKARIAELAKERDRLSRSVNETKAVPKVKERVVMAFNTTDIQRFERLVEKLLASQDKLAQAQQAVVSEAGNIISRINLALTPKMPAPISPQTGRSTGARAPVAARPRDSVNGTGYERRVSGVAAGETAHLNGARLPPGEAKILAAAIQFGGVEKERLRVLCGYKRSARDAYVSRLAKRGYIVTDRAGLIVPTPEGTAALPNSEPLPTGPELRAYWNARLPPGERIILDQLCAAYPRTLAKDEITAGDYARSARDAYISRLAQRGLVVVGRGTAAASPTLFEV
jgi:hypothetical protein